MNDESIINSDEKELIYLRIKEGIIKYELKPSCINCCFFNSCIIYKSACGVCDEWHISDIAADALSEVIYNSLIQVDNKNKGELK